MLRFRDKSKQEFGQEQRPIKEDKLKMSAEKRAGRLQSAPSDDCFLLCIEQKHRTELELCGYHPSCGATYSSEAALCTLGPTLPRPVLYHFFILW